MKKIFVFLVLCFLSVGVSAAEWSNGMDVADVDTIRIVIDGINQSFISKGVTEKRVLNKVEAKARQFRIIPVDEKEDGTFLYVSMGSVGNSFNISINFARTVSYVVNDESFRTLAKTWGTRISGVNSTSSGFIMSSLDELLEEFFNEYLKTNGK